MDNLTHSLTGLALARVGLNRFSPHATALLVLSANAPDADIVALSRGTLFYFEQHRGYTHTLLGLPFMALLTVLVVAAVFRKRLPWRNAWLLCCLGVASHLLLDWTNSYGVRPLLPFSSRWFYLDLNGLYDVCILAALLFAAVWPSFSRLVSNEIGVRSGHGRGLAAFALAFFLLFDCARAVLHARAVAQLEDRLYEDAAPLQTAALPEPLNPFHWTGVVETARAFQRMNLDVFSPAETTQAETFYKPAVTPAYLNAKVTLPFRYFMYFARFPVWSEEPLMSGDSTGTRLVASDLRFGTPDSGSFHCVAVENARGQVLHSGYTVGPETDLQWNTQGRE
jgi:inner membrane protein